jgi:cell division transport system ATP-binding protein
MITFNDVSIAFDLPNGERRPVVERVSMHLDRSDMAYLIGPTGSGKSTLLRLLYMDMFPDEGVAKVGDYRSDLIDRGEIPYLRRSLGVVFQDFQLLPDRSAYDNVAFALYAMGKKRSEVRSRTLKVLTRVGLNHKRASYPHELSGGEQQRVVIARAIANDPWVLLADEPTGNLDPVVADEILELLVSLHRQGMTLLTATHDYRLVKKFPARTFALMNRQLIEIDPESL